MFGLYFGRWLLERGVVTKADINDSFDLPYPAFVHKLVEKGCFTGDEAEGHMIRFKEECDLSDEEIEAINSGDIERIIPVFINFDAAEAVDENLKALQKDSELTDAEMEGIRKHEETGWFIPDYVELDPQHYNRFVRLTVKNILELISDRIVLKKVRQLRKYAFENMACQELKGGHHVFLGFSGTVDGLLMVAGRFAQMEFREMDAKAQDSVCEFVNCINGQYASELSFENVLMRLSLPHWYSNKEITANSGLYCLPIVVEDTEIDLVFSFDVEISIQ